MRDHVASCLVGRFLPRRVIVHNAVMVDRNATTPPPPMPASTEVEHKAITIELADHPDPRARVLAHISTRQFELSERVTDLQKHIDSKFDELHRLLSQEFRDVKEKIAALDSGYIELDARTENLEKTHMNGSSSPMKQ